ncbi:precorrin-8X methylmutase [Magnetospira sp. QH-2]|uniref:precorrin-8X methylmutase n=1 Tax=Magnetospira sp. (strain QH-2) TaxID=1288970 RepID=UPI000B312A88
MGTITGITIIMIMSTKFDYLRDPAAIYAQSFETARAECDLSALPQSLHALALRLVHACGRPELIADLAWGGDPAGAGHRALEAGAPILVDVEMVAHGITRTRLPRDNNVLCRLNDPQVPALAKQRGTTRSAAALDLWGEDLAGAVVAIGNAPTALFRLLEQLNQGAPLPAVILGFPVGFVGAAESKQALIDHAGDIPFVTLKGRAGGSALAAAAVNALAGGVGQ